MMEVTLAIVMAVAIGVALGDAILAFVTRRRK